MKRARTPSSLSATLVPYLLAFTISWALVAAIVFFVGNADVFLFLNQNGNWYTDQIASTITWLGDGTTYAIVCLGLLLWHRRSGLAAIAAFALSSAVSSFFKRVLFHTWVRPKSFFETAQIPIREPEGFAFERFLAKSINHFLESTPIPGRLPDVFALHSYNSFPSGHATSAFSLACLLAFLFPNAKWQLAFLTLAWGVGLSRVVLAQHFPLDIIGGALIGTATSILVRDAFFKWGLAGKLGITRRKPPLPPKATSLS
jgi:membrane-associated phospholipid phosphatase